MQVSVGQALWATVTHHLLQVVGVLHNALRVQLVQFFGGKDGNVRQGAACGRWSAKAQCQVDNPRTSKQTIQVIFGVHDARREGLKVARKRALIALQTEREIATRPRLHTGQKGSAA